MNSNNISILQNAFLKQNDIFGCGQNSSVDSVDRISEHNLHKFWYFKHTRKPGCARAE